MKTKLIFTGLMLLAMLNMMAQSKIFTYPQLGETKNTLIRYNDIQSYAALFTETAHSGNFLTMIDLGYAVQSDKTIKLPEGMTVTDFAFVAKDAVYMIGYSESDRCGYIGFFLLEDFWHGNCTIHYDLFYPYNLLSVAPEDTLEYFDNLTTLRTVMLNNERHLLILGDRVQEIRYDTITATVRRNSCYIDYVLGQNASAYFYSEEPHRHEFDDITITDHYIVLPTRMLHNGYWRPILKIFPIGCYDIANAAMRDAYVAGNPYIAAYSSRKILGSHVEGDDVAIYWDDANRLPSLEHYVHQYSIASSNYNSLSFSVNCTMTHFVDLGSDTNPVADFYYLNSRYFLLKTLPGSINQVFVFDVQNPQIPLGCKFLHSNIMQQSFSKYYHTSPSCILSGVSSGVATISYGATSIFGLGKKCMASVPAEIWPSDYYFEYYQGTRTTVLNKHRMEHRMFEPQFVDLERNIICEMK